MTNDLETFRHFLSIAKVRNLALENRLREEFIEICPMPWLPTTNGKLAEADIAVAKAVRAAGRMTLDLPHDKRLIHRIYKEFWEWREALALFRNARRPIEQEKWAAEQTRKLRTTMEKHL